MENRTLAWPRRDIQGFLRIHSRKNLPLKKEPPSPGWHRHSSSLLIQRPPAERSGEGSNEGSVPSCPVPFWLSASTFTGFYDPHKNLPASLKTTSVPPGQAACSEPPATPSIVTLMKGRRETHTRVPGAGGRGDIGTKQCPDG